MYIELLNRKYQACQECKVPCVGDFKKVAGLQNSCLKIFVHVEKLSSENLWTKRKKDETFILHNAGEKALKRADYIVEICQYKTRCFQCKAAIRRVHSLLDEVQDIKKNEVLGVCEHCKRANPAGKCPRCEFIVNKFLCNKVKMYEDKQTRFKTWLCKVNQLLRYILENENVCKYNLFDESASTAELEKLLNVLRSSLEIRQPEITFFPTETGSMVNLMQSKEMLEELLVKLKSQTLDRDSADSLFVSTSTRCICKYLKDRKIEGWPSIDVVRDKDTKSEPKVLSGILEKSVKRGAGKDNKENTTKDKAKSKTSKEITTDTPEKGAKESKLRNQKLNTSEAMFLKMMKERQQERRMKEAKKSMKAEKVKVFANIEPLPQLVIREMIDVVEDKSESVMECSLDDTPPRKMIKGNKIVPLDPHYKDVTPDAMAPILYKVDAVFSELVVKDPMVSSATTMTTTSSLGKRTKKSKPIEEEHAAKGKIKYALSNSEFIEKGWTILPTIKIMRRLNVYKMKPASPKHDWFERHKHLKIMFYDTGEKLSEIENNGRGKWFYKNGMIALDYYNAQELHTGQRYVVYSSREESDNGKIKPVTVLASFDFLGNGVVYDHYGKERLKYNQNEGIVIDERIGPPSRWKWHSMNDPPILQQVFVDSYDSVRSDSMNDCLATKKDKSEFSSRRSQPPNAEMISIEMENLVKEKAHKLLQVFKPFKIRMKALKVNQQFSLRVLDQGNIYLLFRDGRVSLKLNLGMMLLSSEIVDSVTAEVSEVATPYDRHPPPTPSVAEIQRILDKTRRAAKTRTTNLLNINESVTSKRS